MNMNQEKFNLSWKQFESSMSNSVRNLYSDKDFVDVTIACEDGKQIEAHKVVLSSCSSFFKNILVKNPHQHPLLYLKGVSLQNLKSVIHFMYLGQVEVEQNELDGFMNTAAELMVDGLLGGNRHDSTGEDKNNLNEDYTKLNDSGVQNQRTNFDYAPDLKPSSSEIPINDELENDVYVYKNTEGLFPCDKCAYQAKLRHHLHQHKLTKHEGARYKCDLCERDFAQPSFIGRHKKTIHSNVI